MDIQQYISSGIIEAYILGIASEEEMRELESLSDRYPEIETAIEDCRQTMENFTRLHAVAPPPELKAEIWAQLEAENPESGAPKPPFAERAGNVIDFDVHARKGNIKSMYRPLTASVILLLGSIALNFILWNRSLTVDKKIEELKEEQSKQIVLNERYKEELQRSRQVLEILTDPAIKSIPLAGVGEHTVNSAIVLWDSRTKDVYLSLKNMPPPPDGKQYQLWAIVGGQPVDLGVYELHQKDKLQKMKKIPAAQMFAITLEKEGGSPTPTLEQMFVAGKV